MAPALSSFLLLALGLGTSLTFSSSHWLLAWMGLEINALAILPLMVSTHQSRGTEASVKYLLIQATGAAIILWGSMLNAQITGHWNILTEKEDMTTLIIITGLALKLGVAPVHAWFPEILQGTNMMTAMILSTWQKMAPFILMCEIASSHQWLTLILGLCSIMVGGLAGINMIHMRKLIAYSSIAHFGWMMLIISSNTHLALIALIIYTMATVVIFSTLDSTSSPSIQSLPLSWTKYPALAGLFPLVLLSLGGLPPLSGFMPKWLIIQELTTHNLFLVTFIAAMSALFSLFFYTRMVYIIMSVITPNFFGHAPTKFFRGKFKIFPLGIPGVLALMLLPMLPTLHAFFFY
uniref:NADH dehydrogenase subunit 2 n=1 Tax=Coryphaenoides alateralis TaxID=630668 RepID=UPI0028D14A72|nr:NADH dehydrogenase subunit 2 [Coryphaenoides alateralis]WMY89734.1 NADH dehydrogenase subunit 2 [Coryphaenoides alateralis]